MDVYNILETTKNTLLGLPREIWDSLVETSRTWTFYLFSTPPKKGYSEFKTDYCLEFCVEKTGDQIDCDWRIVKSDEYGEEEVFCLSSKIKKAILKRRSDILGLPANIIEEVRAQMEEACNLLNLVNEKEGEMMIEKKKKEEIEKIINELDTLRAKTIIKAYELLDEAAKELEQLPYWEEYEKINPQSIHLCGHRVDFYVEGEEIETEGVKETRTRAYWELVNFDDREVSINYEIACSILYNRSALKEISKRFIEYIVYKKEQAENVLKMIS